LWAEACNTAIYIQNKSLHKVLGRKTPEEVFTERKPEVGHFMIFRFLVYCHVTSKKRMKLEATAYRDYIPSLRKTVVKRDAKMITSLRVEDRLDGANVVNQAGSPGKYPM
jgi:hypothetical protein